MANNDKVPELGNGVEFDDFVNEGISFVDFFAEWCMPCVMMGPIVDDVSEKFKGKIKFAKVNIDDNEMVASRFNVASIPNFIVFKDGKQIDQFVGSMSEEELEAKLNGFLSD